MNASMLKHLISILPSEARSVLNVAPTIRDTCTSFKHGPGCEWFFVFCDGNVQAFLILQCHGELAVSFYLGVFKYTIGTVIFNTSCTVVRYSSVRLWQYVISCSVKDELI